VVCEDPSDDKPDAFLAFLLVGRFRYGVKFLRLKDEVCEIVGDVTRAASARGGEILDRIIMIATTRLPRAVVR
jgi:hypothetical protein